jgi:EpsI family protein
MLDNRTILVPLFLAAQTLAIHWVGLRESPPRPPDLSLLPAEFGNWKTLRTDPIAADVAQELRADGLLSRTYMQAPDGRIVDLFLAWFQSQRGGASQPHSPKVCLPGAGWTSVSTGETTLATTDGTYTVNRYVVTKDQQRAVVLYWYQTPRRVIASEWASKFWVVADGLRYRRTDISLVRVIAWSTGNGDRAATDAATSFAQKLYPLLREHLP